MAAFAALVSLRKNVHLIHNHRRHSFSFEEKQLFTLWESTTFLIKFMKSYDDSHGARKEAGEALEMRIARAAQAAEDVIESHVVDQIRSGKTRTSSITSPPRFLLDLQKAIEGLDYMKRKAMIVKAQSGMDAEQQTHQPTNSAAAASSTTLTSIQTTMVGCDDVLLRLLHELTGLPSSRRIIPIVGMGGIGKTTLARNAFEHLYIVQHFDVCLWATISQQYNVQKILTQLVSVDETCNGDVAELGLRLHKSLYRRRYLIILDDMWSLEAWDEIKFFFPDNDNGSRIVVTTRHLDVAKHIAVSRGVTMRFLDEDKSWDLFCRKAFAAEQGCPLELEEIGKKIVGKCKGLPLAIVVVGGHFRKSSMTLEYWENVAQHLNSVLNSTEDEEHCMHVLALSYSYLPAHLKPCFLLLGALPEDEKISVEDIVRLWIAEGFIEAFKDIRSEDVAEYYLWDLFERNLILVDILRVTGGISKIKLHDLIRELCLQIAIKEEFLYVLDTPRAISRERRVVISGKFPELNHLTNIIDAPVRCLVCKGERLPYELRLLRTLKEVVALSINESIFHQVNLRYLNVDLSFKTHPTLYYLPSSISLLWNLQILKIGVPTQSKVIAPYEIWEMLQLRDLEVIPICLLDPLPVDRLDKKSDLVLRNLHNLWGAENFRLSEEVCKRIPNIRTLNLLYCDEADSYYCPQNLGCFHKLEILELRFRGDSRWRDFALSLTFPISLKVLSLSGCGVDWEELTVMVGSLPHLLCLRLYRHSVIGSVWTPVDGKFLSLKYLFIFDCDDLIHWHANSSHFPVLKKLILGNVPKLDEFPSDIGEIPTLREIELKFCSLSSTISAMRTLVEQEALGNEGLRLNVTFRGDGETLESFKNQVQEEGLTSNNLDLRFVKPKSL